jgi:hypothetical protein
MLDTARERVLACTGFPWETTRWTSPCARGRVLRPGGRLLISDLHHDGVLRGSIPPVVDQDGTRGRLPVHRHLVGDYPGFTVLACEEPRLPSDDQGDQRGPLRDGGLALPADHGTVTTCRGGHPVVVRFRRPGVRSSLPSP